MHAKRTAWSAVTVLALALGGCASYRPAPLIPEAELDALSRRGIDPLPAAPPRAVPTEWFPLVPDIDFADGLSLAEANTLALFYASKIRAARSAADVAAGQLLQAGLLRNPELFVGPRFTTDPTDVILPADLLFAIPLGGRRGAERDRAEASLDAARLDVMAVELETLVEVRRRFLHVATLDEERRILDAVALQTDAAMRWSERLEEAGEASALAAALTRLERDEVRQELRDKEAELAAARAELFELVGLLPAAPVEIAAPDHALPPLPPADPKAALGHPRLRRQEAIYREAEQALRLEVAKQYPEIRIGPSYEDAQGQGSLGFGLALDLPVFDRNRGNIAAAEAARNAAREAYQAEVLRLAREEAAARARHDASRGNLDEYRSGTLASIERAERVIAERLRGGQSSILELLEARRAAARARLRAAALGERVAVAALDSAYAGGFVLPRAPEGETKP